MNRATSNKRAAGRKLEELRELRLKVERTAKTCMETSSDPKDKESHRIWRELRLADIDAKIYGLSKGRR